MGFLLVPNQVLASHLPTFTSCSLRLSIHSHFSAPRQRSKVTFLSLPQTEWMALFCRCVSISPGFSFPWAQRLNLLLHPIARAIPGNKGSHQCLWDESNDNEKAPCKWIPWKGTAAAWWASPASRSLSVIVLSREWYQLHFCWILCA